MAALNNAPTVDPLGHLNDLTLPHPRAVVLSGPLGSGKTTLLNHLLHRVGAEAPAGSIVVIENDIGARNTDAPRLAIGPENVLAITAGCICCNDLHSLRAAVEQLRTQGGVETLFIETTGIANPGSVKDLLHERGIPAKTIVTVDVAHFERNHALGRDADTIPHADIIALTWWEGQVSIDHLQRVIEVVRAENDTAPILFIDHVGNPAPIPSHEKLLGESAGRLLPLESAEGSRLIPAPPALLSLTPHLTHHRLKTFSVSLSIPAEFSPNTLVSAVEEGVDTANLLRAKGHLNGFEFDCTHGDWRFGETRAPLRSNYVTLIATEPLHSARFPRLRPLESLQSSSFDLSNPDVYRRAVELVQELIAKIPANVVEDGRLITESEAGEGWRYVSQPEFPGDIRENYLRSLLDFYLRQHQALATGIFDSSPTLPYYKREVGYNLSWFTFDCAPEVARWGLTETIRETHPNTLYFEGLAAAKSALHIGSFREGDIPYLRERLRALASEMDDDRALSLPRRAIENCCRLSLDKSWTVALRQLL